MGAKSTSRHLRTSDLANAVGVHPNTVRLYEVWGFLPPIPRSPSGYRLFTEAHLAQMRLARTALRDPWPGRQIRRSALTLVRRAASGDLGGALEQAHHHLALVQAERAQAETAVEVLQHWIQGLQIDATAGPLQIGEAAHVLDVTTDVLRNWERNGLIQVPRNPRNAYRQYGAAELARLRIIRLLLHAGCSTMAVLRLFLFLDRGQNGDLLEVLDSPPPDEGIISAADRWLTTLAALERSARDLIAQLVIMSAR